MHCSNAADSVTGVEPATIVGFVGVALIVAAYFANQQGWLGSDDWRFPLANLVGSLLILVSLYTAWNFPSAVNRAARGKEIPSERKDDSSRPLRQRGR